MRPPLLLHVFPSFNVGGAQSRFVALANHHGRAFRHAVVSIDGQLTCRERLSAGLDVTFPLAECGDGNLARRLIAIRRTIIRIAPDLLITSNWGAIDWAIARLGVPGLPHLHTEDGFGPEERSSQLPRRAWTRRLVLRGSTVVVPSLTLQTIASKVWKLPPQRLHYIPNGIDVERFVPAPPHANAVFTVGTVAGLRPEKNISRLLRAFAMLRQRAAARLIIVGDGPDRAALRTLAQDLGVGDDVQFAGERRNVEVAYRDFDVFALSSDTEQMPLCVLEAMASGLPVVSTAVGDVTAMVAPSNLPMVTSLAQNESGLATSLYTLFDAPALRARIGWDNRARAVAEFGEAAMARAYAELYSARRPASMPAQYRPAISTAAQLK